MQVRPSESSASYFLNSLDLVCDLVYWVFSLYSTMYTESPLCMWSFVLDFLLECHHMYWTNMKPMYVAYVYMRAWNNMLCSACSIVWDVNVQMDEQATKWSGINKKNQTKTNKANTRPNKYTKTRPNTVEKKRVSTFNVQNPSSTPAVNSRQDWIPKTCTSLNWQLVILILIVWDLKK